MNCTSWPILWKTEIQLKVETFGYVKYYSPMNTLVDLGMSLFLGLVLLAKVTCIGKGV